jgi:hypothetical protein
MPTVRAAGPRDVLALDRPSPAESRRRDAARAQAIARWMDGAMLDPLVGLLVPGAGDLASSALGLVVVGLAVRHRLPAVVIARMLLNLAIVAAAGAVPIVGDLFDLVHRAHRKNAELFVARHDARPGSWRDWATVAGAAAVFLVGLALPILVLLQVWRSIM